MAIGVTLLSQFYYYIFLINLVQFLHLIIKRYNSPPFFNLVIYNWFRI